MSISYQRVGDVPILGLAEALEELTFGTRTTLPVPGGLTLRAAKASEDSYVAELELPDGSTEARRLGGVVEVLAWVQEVQDRQAGDVTTGGETRASEHPAVVSDDDASSEAAGAGTADDGNI